MTPMAPLPLFRVVLLAAHVFGIRGRICSDNNEDCSHTGCCSAHGHSCYKKNYRWAACLPTGVCVKGINHHDPPAFRTPWSCKLINAEHLDCAEDEEDCIHLGCCQSPNRKCFMKNPGEAFCRKDCPDKHSWSCHIINAYRPKGDASHIKLPRTKHNEDLTQGWKGGMHATHYWDCNGAGCDAAFLSPWVQEKYVSPSQYAPMDPNEFGGSLYGEALWMTGAASDQISDSLGPDANFCGTDNEGGGGCGQCMLVKNAASNNPHMMAIVMKKNRCPPWSHGCERPNFHMDFAVPGFDNLQYSTANICGNKYTQLQKHESAICGSTAPHACDCNRISAHTPGLQKLKKGCELFKKWGWHHGTPVLDFRPVPCPKNFVEQVKLGAAFGPAGIVGLSDASLPGNVSAALPVGAKAKGTEEAFSLFATQPRLLLLTLPAAGLAAVLARASVGRLRRRATAAVDDEAEEALVPQVHE